MRVTRLHRPLATQVSRPHVFCSGNGGLWQRLKGMVGGGRSAPLTAAQVIENQLAPLGADIEKLKKLGEKIAAHMLALNTQRQQLVAAQAHMATRVREIKTQFDAVNGVDQDNARVLSQRGKELLSDVKKIKASIEDRAGEFDQFLQKWFLLQQQIGKLSEVFEQVKQERDNAQRREEILSGLRDAIALSQTNVADILQMAQAQGAGQNAAIASLIASGALRNEGIDLPAAIGVIGANDPATVDVLAAARKGEI